MAALRILHPTPLLQFCLASPAHACFFVQPLAPRPWLTDPIPSTSWFCTVHATPPITCWSLSPSSGSPFGQSSLPFRFGYGYPILGRALTHLMTSQFFQRAERSFLDLYDAVDLSYASPPCPSPPSLGPASHKKHTPLSPLLRRHGYVHTLPGPCFLKPWPSSLRFSLRPVEFLLPHGVSYRLTGSFRQNQ